MMDPPTDKPALHSYLTSPPFEFIVGSNRRSFFVNASLIASQSKPLTSLVSGSGGGSSPERGQMRESIEKRAILEDIDEDTFARFVEFALTNSYTPAQPCEYVSSSEGESESDEGDSAEGSEDDGDMENDVGGGRATLHHYDDMTFTEIPTMPPADPSRESSRKRRKGRKKEAGATYSGVGKRTKSGSNYKFPPSPVSSARGADSDSEHQRTASASSVGSMMLNTSASVQQPPMMYGRFTATGPVFSAQPPPGYGYTTVPSSINQSNSRKPFNLNATKIKTQPPSFNSLPFAAAPPPRALPSSPRQNEPDEDCTPVFLSHAKLYVFAEKYDVANLRALTLHNLHSCLSRYRVWPDPRHEGEEGGRGAKDLVNLINYAYENTLNDEGEELRRLVSWFCAWRAKALLQCKFYCGCLEVGGMGVGFVRDLVGKLATMAPSDD